MKSGSINTVDSLAGSTVYRVDVYFLVFAVVAVLSVAVSSC